MTSAAFLAARLGAPYGPDATCWDLVSEAQAALWGRTVPHDVGEPPKAARRVKRGVGRSWAPSADPVEGAVAIMGRGPGREEHAGVMIADGSTLLVLHTDRPHGVVLDTLAAVAARGWRHLTFWTPRAP